MRDNPLCRIGLFVSELAVGTNTFGGKEDMWATVGGLEQDAASAQQLSANLEAARVILSADDLAQSEASALPPEYPGWMIATQGAYRRGQLNPAPRVQA